MSMVFRNMVKHWRPLFAGLLLALLGSASGLAQPLAAQAVIESLGAGRSLLVPALLLALFLVTGAVGNAANSYLLDRTGEQVVLGIRRQLAARLVRLRVSELDARSPADLVTRATSDTCLLRSAAVSAPVALVNGLLGLLGALTLMAMLDLGLFAITAVALISCGAISAGILPRIRMATERAQAAVGTVGATLDRTLGAARTVKANNAERREQAAVDRASEAAFRSGVTAARWEALLVAVTELAMQLSFLIVLAVGGSLVAKGSMSMAKLVAFLLYLLYLITPISELVMAAGNVQQGRAAANRLAEVEQMPVEDGCDLEHDLDHSGESAVRAAPALEFDDVRFAHPGRPDALCGVCFEVAAASRIALVGPSGAGKSTLLSLLLRFDDPSSGEIRVNGVTLSSIPRTTMRAMIGYVEQDAPVLDGTLRDNVLLSVPEASEDDLIGVIRATCLDELVARLPAGLDTPVGARGVTLSGGERQRVAIARALLRRPSLLLLDEPTAHLDGSTEQAVQSLLSGQRTGSTVIVVAHRLSTVRDADAIVVLDGGQVRAIGTHTELLASDAVYRSLAADRSALIGPPSPRRAE